MRLARPFRAPIVGLDIGSSTIKAIALRRGRSGWAIAAAAESPTPPNAFEDGAIADPVAVADAVRQMFQPLRMRRARVAAALSGHSVIVKRLSVPTMTDAELAEAMPWEAEQYIPFELSEVQLDYQVLGSSGASGQASLDVLLVAAKRDRIEDRASVIVQAGREPAVLDVEAFALANAYEVNYPDRQDPLAALIHVGRRTAVVCLLEHGHPAFIRDISFGGQAHTDALVRELNVDELTAERLKHGRGPTEISREHVASILRDVTSQLVAEIKKSIDFYRATAPIERLSRLELSGGASRADGLADLLSAEFGAPVDVWDPFRRIERPKGRVTDDIAGPAFAVAIGLALRQEAA